MDEEGEEGRLVIRVLRCHRTRGVSICRCGPGECRSAGSSGDLVQGESPRASSFRSDHLALPSQVGGPSGLLDATSFLHVYRVCVKNISLT